jgi:hypothetical protein
MGTVFIIHSDLPYGFISGKYFCFYLSIGIVTITTILNMKNALSLMKTASRYFGKKSSFEKLSVKSLSIFVKYREMLRVYSNTKIRLS